MPQKKRKKRTETSSFGSPGRAGHDSSKFYNSRLYEGQTIVPPDKYIENPVNPSAIDKIFEKSSECMENLADHSIHLMVTSPPYNVTKEYDDNLSLKEYLDLLKKVFTETYRVLVTGGRACVNIANVGRKPYIPLHSFIIQIMLDIGFHMRGEIIWDKSSSAGSSTAWGSWMSASNPTLRDTHEYILVFSKESFNRENLPDKENTISRDEFLEFTKSVWQFPAERAKKVGHPAPFPVELPYRLIQLYTFRDEIILDPFCGSGSSCLAAFKSGRHYVGYEIDPEYIKLAEKRVKEYNRQFKLDLEVI